MYCNVFSLILCHTVAHETHLIARFIYKCWEFATAAHEAGCLRFNNQVIHIVLAADRGHSLEILISSGQWPGVGTVCPSVLWTGPVLVIYLGHYFSPYILATQPVCTSCLRLAPEVWLLLCALLCAECAYGQNKIYGKGKLLSLTLGSRLL